MSTNTLPSTLSFSSNGGSYPPHGIIDANNHGPYVVVTTWIVMSTVVLSAATRLLVRMKTISIATVDNAVILFGTVGLTAPRSGYVYATNESGGLHSAMHCRTLCSQ